MEFFDAVYYNLGVNISTKKEKKMYVLNTNLSKQEVLDIVINGIPAYSWSNLPSRAEIGNFYKTFQIIPNNIKSLEPLFFRNYFISERDVDDKVGPIYQASHYHVGLFQCNANEAGDYVSGFQTTSSNPVLEHFGQLQGLQGLTPLGNRIVFSENSDFKTSTATSSGEEIYPIYPSTKILSTTPPVDLLPLVKAGYCLLWIQANSPYYPFAIHQLFETRTYFRYSRGATEMRYRGLYMLEAMLPPRQEDSIYGKYFIVGFGVSHNHPTKLRGFGAIELLSADAVKFESSQK